MKNKKLFAILTLVCFMFTLMPVAAFASIDEQQSYVYLQDKEVKVGKAIDVEFDLVDGTVGDKLYVWFEEVGYEDIAVKAVAPADESCATTDVEGILEVTLTDAAYAEFSVKIDRAGEFKVYAVADTKPADVEAAKKEALRTQSGYDVVTVGDVAANSSKYYITFDGEDYADGKSVVLGDEFVPGESNGIEDKTIAFYVYDKAGNAVYAKDIEIEGTSAIDVTDVEAFRSGKVSFDYTVAKAGNHKIYVTLDSYNFTFKVNTSDVEAEDIELSYISQTPVNIASANTMLERGLGLGNWVVFKVYDSNGAEVTTIGEGIYGVTDADAKYVTIVDQPADSDLKSSDFTANFVGNIQVNNMLAAEAGLTIFGDTQFVEEGKYTFKVALDNGNYATASITVKEAGDPVSLMAVYDTNSVQLGASIAPKTITLLDKNYVASSPENVEFAATGAAIDYVDGTTIYVKDNEKYVGSTIKVTIIDKDNSLVATKTLTVADEANELAFDTDVVAVDVEKTVTVTLVDANGNAVALPTDATSTSAYVLVLDKPADTEATAEFNEGSILAKKGQFTFDFSADKAGVYEVQAVLQVKVDNAWRYYTGVQEIKVGATGIEDTVVMSINAAKIVVNDEVKAIPAAPIIKDSRTFVPFRALAEAFGAEVEWVEATQSVVAELDGTKVVMNIGAKAYTVNGVAKTADVAPFINGASTMVPVRFVAEAFGITVTPIAAEDGSIADVLFTK